ncbi:hypothetical protein P280DRAFT_517285 [Massarina eburnea CBS 473.64]|uniref:MYND-type domain-containing protein n=1 Tax=Massarina eburnea CBS 473.64 TaxID=1395130 RepID=A0A6A6S315_9PLEO|nr:hypothetical protein P280DRAFT_517285 [Massarina eburnea CBS 473.64]
MPPRSVCLNVFTTSLSSGIPKEAGVSIREFAGQNLDMKEKDAAVAERARHDSVQGSPNADNMHSYNESTSPRIIPTIDVSSFPDDMVQPTSNANLSATSTCSTCGQLPSSGSTLQRCSRCKSAYYCSKVCQKTAWKLHKVDCLPGGASGFATPNISTPGSPVHQHHAGSDLTMAERLDLAAGGEVGGKHE